VASPADSRSSMCMSVCVRSWSFRAALRASGCAEREGGARKRVRGRSVDVEVEVVVGGVKSGVSSIVKNGGMAVRMDWAGGMCEASLEGCYEEQRLFAQWD
jgi:hypothetical protein